jgi:hypothetical protein
LLDELRIPIPASAQTVNFPAQASLPAINPSGIQEDRAADLAVRLIAFRLFENGNRNQ